jgi:ParB-like chromosome segregation protein Spo0J
MEIIQRKTADLIPYVNNARTHSEQQVLQIAASIKEFGFTNPVLVDGENGIIAGHGRVLAAKKLGLDKVPTIELKHLTKTQKKAYILADNRLALNSGWNNDLLALELGELKLEGFNLELIGFEVSTITENNFNPNINPTYTEKEIDSKDFDRANSNIEKTITGTERKFIGVICPNCGEEFEIES